MARPTAVEAAVCGAVDAATEAGTQDARRAAGSRHHDVQACDVTAELTDPGGIGDEQGFHGLDRCTHERVLVASCEVRDGDRRGLAVDGTVMELTRGRGLPRSEHPR